MSVDHKRWDSEMISIDVLQEITKGKKPVNTPPAAAGKHKCCFIFPCMVTYDGGMH